MNTQKSSEYVKENRRTYSLYVLTSRAIPSLADGLKASQRRVLWTARNGNKVKSATLGGATMPIHPHQAPEGAINTLAAPYGNNIPLLDGDGAFGTLLNPGAYGAARYTSVKVSVFTKDVVFRDIEIIPMVENYDGTLQEPKHFLPLVPVALINPSEGIAVGFASTILPRDLPSIVRDQISILDHKKIKEKPPVFKPVDAKGVRIEGNRWAFSGQHERINSTNIRITQLPYGADHNSYIDFLIKLEDEGKIVDFEDNSKDKYDIRVKFKRGIVDEPGKVMKILKLTKNHTENMNVLDFDGQRVVSTNYTEVIERFTKWRLTWYKKRYQRLADLLAIDIQRYKDILRAITKNVGGVAKKTQSRSELKDFLTEIDIVHIDYIADLAVYRFTEEEKKKTQAKLKEAEGLMKWYQKVLSSEKERVKIYKSELEEILANHKRGLYG